MRVVEIRACLAALIALGGCLAIEDAYAGQDIVDPGILELGLASYKVTVLNEAGTKGVPYTYGKAIMQRLSYAFSQSFAVASAVAVSGHDLVVGALELRWFPRHNAAQLSEKDGTIEVGRVSHFKPFVVGKLEYGIVRSPYFFPNKLEVGLDETFQGAGVGVGSLFDVTEHIGVGLSVSISHWVDAPASAVVMNSNTVAMMAGIHFNF